VVLFIIVYKSIILFGFEWRAAGLGISIEENQQYKIMPGNGKMSRKNKMRSTMLFSS